MQCRGGLGVAWGPANLAGFGLGQRLNSASDSSAMGRFMPHVDCGLTSQGVYRPEAPPLEVTLIRAPN
jgi:hypothetical protein